MQCVCRVRVKTVLILQQTFTITPVMSIISVGCTRYLKLIIINSLAVPLGVRGSIVFLCAAKIESSVSLHMSASPRTSDLLILNPFHRAQTCERINYSRKSFLPSV